tara:strand:- start:166 stop:444 length:279 start_codon:yes stop_codon:yes gene_type:complete
MESMMNRILWGDSPLDCDVKDPKYHIATLYNDNGALTFKWATNPEPIVMLGMKNPNLNVVRDESGKAWSGQHLIYFINSCPIKVYSSIGSWF